MTSLFAVDAHVHFHRPAAVAPALDHAARNFAAATGRPSGFLGALLLAQTSRERVFEWLCGESCAGRWRVELLSGEPHTMLVRGAADRSMAVINGRQVRAAGGLEVLALGTCADFPDGISLREAVAAVRASGALTVLPWGFGKWWGRRGRLVRAVLDTCSNDAVLLGDNGGRLRWGPEPAILREYEGRGYRILPGTDPFPFGKDLERLGRRGVLCDRIPPMTGPWDTLRRVLQTGTGVQRTFGSGVGVGRFLVNNIGIQVYNRVSIRGAP